MPKVLLREILSTNKRLDTILTILYNPLMSVFTSFYAKHHVTTLWFATYEQIATVHVAA
jgi:hypothetical protein